MRLIQKLPWLEHFEVFPTVRKQVPAPFAFMWFILFLPNEIQKTSQTLTRLKHASFSMKV